MQLLTTEMKNSSNHNKRLWESVHYCDAMSYSERYKVKTECTVAKENAHTVLGHRNMMHGPCNGEEWMKYVWHCWLEAILHFHWTFILDSFHSHIAEVVKSIWDLRFSQWGLLQLLTSCVWWSPRTTLALPRVKLLYNYCRHLYACSSEIPAHLYHTTWHHNHNDSNVQVQDKFKISKTDQSHTPPGGMTSVLQTLDTCTQHTFKASFKHQYTEYVACGTHKLTLTK